MDVSILMPALKLTSRWEEELHWNSQERKSGRRPSISYNDSEFLYIVWNLFLMNLLEASSVSTLPEGHFIVYTQEGFQIDLLSNEIGSSLSSYVKQCIDICNLANWSSIWF